MSTTLSRKWTAIYGFLMVTIMAFTTVVLGMPTAWAVAENPDDFTFNSSDDGTTITGLSDKGKDSAKDGAINIPGTINGKTVVALGDKAFFDMGVKDVTFPDTPLKKIGS